MDNNLCFSKDWEKACRRSRWKMKKMGEIRESAADELKKLQKRQMGDTVNKSVDRTIRKRSQPA